jgi:hypothetical protein
MVDQYNNEMNLSPSLRGHVDIATDLEECVEVAIVLWQWLSWTGRLAILIKSWLAVSVHKI